MPNILYVPTYIGRREGGRRGGARRKQRPWPETTATGTTWTYIMAPLLRSAAQSAANRSITLIATTTATSITAPLKTEGFAQNNGRLIQSRRRLAWPSSHPAEQMPLADCASRLARGGGKGSHSETRSKTYPGLSLLHPPWRGPVRTPARAVRAQQKQLHAFVHGFVAPCLAAPFLRRSPYYYLAQASDEAMERDGGGA